MIADQFAKPLIATSGNISGSPIIYEDSEALENLFEVADMVLTYDRRIVTPQDDSVIRFTDGGRKIILRRSRGLAPNYFPHFFPKTRETILATGGELKSAFAIQHKNKVYVSQYLGDQATLESQQSYLHTLYQMSNLLKAKQGVVLIDKHPGYFVSQTGKELSKETYPGTAFAIQHHKAHFGAVLAENDLLRNHISVLGFIWDGTGYGEDGQIWGSESFIFLENIMTRVAHLEYFPQLLGDKMSREPRLSALSILKDFPSANRMIEKYFSIAEWQYYSKMIRQDQLILTSSMGRFLDALACILGICPWMILWD
jgi:hydrogenase maturation protein HypF